MYMVLNTALRVVLVLTLVVSIVVAQDGALTIQVVEGQGAIHNVKRGTAFEPVVEVRDRFGKPAAGASVTFTLPAIGASATFPDGSRTLMIQTDAAGRATARGLRPNTIVGPFEIRVVAAKDGETANALIPQTNAAPSSSEKSSPKKWAIILGVVGAAAAGGVLAASGGGNSTTRTAAPPSTPASGTITPGTPGFGPP